MSNMRFHLFALGGIILVITALFMMSEGAKGPDEAAAPRVIIDNGKKIEVEPVGEFFVTIWEASWGLNCNELSINPRDAKAGIPIPERVKPNNVLADLSSMCNGKETCSFRADGETLGDPMKDDRCRPVLELVYRCFSFDRPWRVIARDHEDVVIDCKDR